MRCSPSRAPFSAYPCTAARPSARLHEGAVRPSAHYVRFMFLEPHPRRVYGAGHRHRRLPSFPPVHPSTVDNMDLGSYSRLIFRVRQQLTIASARLDDCLKTSHRLPRFPSILQLPCHGYNGRCCIIPSQTQGWPMYVLHISTRRESDLIRVRRFQPA